MNKWKYNYPRPLLKRNSFFSLDGEWLLNKSKIEVPFPMESSLSGYNGSLKDNILIYEKDFSLPTNFKKQNDIVLLHFGAVDQICEVYLNNKLIATHNGGYTNFEIDITGHLEKHNHLRVECIDELNKFFPYGKQTKKPEGMWYTQVSGIWQSVWIEAVPKNYIKNIFIQTTLDKLIIDIDSDNIAFFVSIPINKRKAIKQYYETKHIEIDLNQLENKRIWKIDDPYLYPVIISTKTDEVESYFAIREVKVIDNQLYLNNEKIVLKGVLDQGYYKDGLFLPEDPLEYFNDILKMKELGFNCLRKHLKLEPQTFYFACDKMGMLVIQDMVNSGKFNFIYHAALPTIGIKINNDKLFKDKRRFDFFIDHSSKIINSVKSHPSIVAYTIYNEGWGQQYADKAYDLLKALDPNRLFDTTSGWFNKHNSDFNSYHVYFKNKVLKRKDKLLLLSECGGFSNYTENHCDLVKKEYGYAKTNSEEALMNEYNQLYEKMIYPSIKNGMVGYIITQLSDVENEINGFYTYDREICKVDKKRILELNENVNNHI